MTMQTAPQTALKAGAKVSAPLKPPTRVVSLWLPNFPIDRLSRQSAKPPHPEAAPPQATVLKEQGGLRIAAVNPAAQAVGIGPGLPLSDARALQPDLKVTPAEPARDIRALAALADWCGRYTPWTAPEAGGDAGESGDGIWLDISGCAHLFGGEADLLEDLIGRMHGLGYAARAAAADTPGAAWAVARFDMTPGQDTAIVPPGGARKALADLPVAALRLSPMVVEGLARLGLRRAGDLYDLPRGPLVTRFGESLIRRVDQALGRVGEPISPHALPPAYRARLSFAEPVGRTEDVEAATRQLLATLCRDLERDCRGARRLELLCYRVDGETLPITIGTSQPVRDASHLWRLFKEHFGAIDAGFGIDVMVLGARATEALAVEQTDLADSTGQRDRRLAAGQISSDEGAEARMSPLIDQLANRLGAANVVRLASHESYLPERAVYAVPVLKAGRDGRQRAWDSGPAWFVNRPRPVSLFHPPQPVEATAPVPDDPPVLFRWRRVVHRVAYADGPERIAPEWWEEAFGVRKPPLAGMPESALTRDYYRVEDEDGGRFWLYRNGLYRPDQSCETPRWYLHGVFA